MFRSNITARVVRFILAWELIAIYHHALFFSKVNDTAELTVLPYTCIVFWVAFAPKKYLLKKS
jgi:hypothetical protein